LVLFAVESAVLGIDRIGAVVVALAFGLVAGGVLRLLVTRADAAPGFAGLAIGLVGRPRDR